MELPCKHCDKVFRGDTRTVSKQFEMHLKYIHGIEHEDSPFVIFERDMTHNRILNLDNAKKEMEFVAGLSAFI